MSTTLATKRSDARRKSKNQQLLEKIGRLEKQNAKLAQMLKQNNIDPCSEIVDHSEEDDGWNGDDVDE